MNLKPHQQAILASTLLAALSTTVPFVSRLFLPVLWLDTHIHELCHALVAMACGANVEKIMVLANGSGYTPIAGGNIILEGSAGYVGASIVGALIIFFSRTGRSAQMTLRVLSVTLGISMLTLVRGDLVGIVSGIGWIAALWCAAQFLRGFWLVFCAQLVGLLQCLNAVQALYELLQITTFKEGISNDALIVQHGTGIPAIIWALLWCAISLALIGFTLYRSWISKEPLLAASSTARNTVNP